VRRAFLPARDHSGSAPRRDFVEGGTAEIVGHGRTPLAALFQGFGTVSAPRAGSMAGSESAPGFSVREVEILLLAPLDESLTTSTANGILSLDSKERPMASISDGFSQQTVTVSPEWTAPLPMGPLLWFSTAIEGGRNRFPFVKPRSNCLDFDNPSRSRNFT